MMSAARSRYRFRWVFSWALALCLPAFHPRLEAVGQTSKLQESVSTVPIPSSWRDDADLRDVFFLDADYGWAVGDLGVIWQTENGGAVWRRQSTPVDCQLARVHFIDRRNGWAVGGYSHPLTHRSSGIVLRTQDGGRTWEEISGLLLPWLTSVHFLNERRGVAAGMASALHPSGVFSTEDGGRTWTPLHGVYGSHWAVGSFQNTTGLLVSRTGRAAWLDQGGLRETATADQFSLFNAAYAQLLDARVGFIGHGSPPLLSVNRGQSWQPVGALPEGAIKTFQFTTFFVLGNHCWLAGDPGTRIFRSPDHARSWQGRPTGGTLPVHRLHFTDVDRGWAVGRRGLILATDDGGQTWKAQRGGGKRAALLAIFPAAEDVPWDLLAKASAADQYRVHLVLLGAPASALDPLCCPPESRLEEASMHIGATGEILTRLPLPDHAQWIPASKLIRRWEREEPIVMECLTARLAGLIRTWRPDVVLTSRQRSSEDGLTGVQRITSRLVTDACELAASDVALADQIARAGLQPWKATRVLSLHPTRPSVDRPSGRDILVRGRWAGDFARESQRLMGNEPKQHAKPWELVSLEPSGGGAGSTLGSQPLAGLSRRFGTAARRPRDVIEQGQAVDRRAAEQQSHVRNLLLRGDALIGKANLLEQADRLLATIEPSAAGNVLWEMAQHAIETGQLERAAEIYLRLIHRYDDHALSDYAMRWLIAYHASAEVGWRRARGQQQAPLHLVPAAWAADAKSEADARTLEAPQTNTAVEAATPPPDESFEQTAIDLARQLESKRPELYACPEILFPLSAVLRARGQPLQAKALYRRQLQLPATTAWRQWAAEELSLAEPTSSHQALHVWPCVHVDDRPHLDGTLSDDCWQRAEAQWLERRDPWPQSPTTPSASPSETKPRTQVLLAHDDQYLYFAATCEKHPGATYLPIRRPRPRDAHLEGLDRIALLLDIDRDYVSSWRMTFDHRGWTAESVFEDAHWNPTYYVASTTDDQAWTIEVAIPLPELAPPSRLQAGSRWRIAVQRLIRGHETQSWPPARMPRSNETSGLLLIQ